MRHEFVDGNLGEVVVNVYGCVDSSRFPLQWREGVDGVLTRVQIFRGEVDYTVSVVRRDGRLEVDAPDLVVDEQLSRYLVPESASTRRH